MKFDKIYLSYSGGLGNQMFEYAFEQKLKLLGKNVQSDLSIYRAYPNSRPFNLTQIFKNVNIDIVDEEEMHAIRRKYKWPIRFAKAASQITFMGIWNREKKEFQYDKSVFKIKRGVLEGYWQCYKYFEDIREQLLHAFVFPQIKDKEVSDLIDKMRCENSISLHVRGGDYLSPVNIRKYGNICTIEYYRKTIEYIEKNIENPVFYIFTNDVVWTKENIQIENAVWVDEKISSEREDWIDMYLMSECKHNIIANSTFSWWGAWLNQNADKIVIAPKKWLNGLKKEELCPKEWIRI